VAAPDQLFANTASTTITSTITASQTSLPVASSASFPTAVSAQDREFQAAFLDDATTPPTIREFVTVRNVDSSTSWTVVRAAEDPSRFPAGAWTSGTRIAHVCTAEGFRNLLPKSRSPFHDVRDFGAIGTNDTSNAGAVDNTQAFYDAADAANACIQETFKTNDNGTGIVYVPGNRDFKVGAATPTQTPSPVDGAGCCEWPVNVRMIGGTGTGHGTAHPPRLRWHGPAGGMMFSSRTTAANLPGIHIENVKFDGRSIDGSPTGGANVAGYGNGAATWWTMGGVSGSGGKLDTGCDMTDVHVGSFHGDAFRIENGATNGSWLRGRFDQIGGYAFYFHVATGVFYTIMDMTYDNALANDPDGRSKGFVHIDLSDQAANNSKCWLGLHDLHLEVNGGLAQTYVPTGWTPVGTDTRGLIRINVNVVTNGMVQAVIEYNHIWIPIDPAATPFSIFQFTSADLTGDYRNRHAVSARIVGGTIHGLANGSSNNQDSAGACQLIGGVNAADSYPFIPASNGVRQVNRLTYQPNPITVPSNERGVSFHNDPQYFKRLHLPVAGTTATGGAGTLPANPVGFLTVYDETAGTARRVPYYS
jgi:hypothetical protein